MSRVAIVAALEREVRPLVKHWRVSEKEHDGRRFRFFEKNEVVLVCGGIGADAARRAAEAVIVLYGPTVVYSAGYAGALDPRVKVGEVIRAGRVVNAGDGSSAQIAGGDGILVSYPAVATPSQKVKLRESYQAQAVDMEAAAVARAAEARGVGFCALKVISDEFDFEFPPTDRFVDSAGRFHEMGFALFAAVRPWLWLPVLRLARNSGRASRILCEEIRKLEGQELAPTLQGVKRQ
jgi:adenosylhomocysteine nucleosidase